MSEMISFGGGVNSTAMTILLVEQGWRGPIVFADVGDDLQPCEHPETLCYLNYFEREYLRPHGLELTRLRPGSEYHRNKKAAHGLYTYCLEAGVVPLTAVRWCSIEWKRNPLENWRLAHDIPVVCIGIAADEARRVRESPEHRYPLVDDGINRAGCVRVIEQAGLEVPRKSGCWFCPNQRLNKWRRLLIDHPELYAKAEELEENAERAVLARGRITRTAPVSLDPHGMTLRDKRTRRAWDGQLEMDLPGMARPCICGL